MYFLKEYDWAFFVWNIIYYFFFIWELLYTDDIIFTEACKLVKKTWFIALLMINQAQIQQVDYTTLD